MASRRSDLPDGRHLLAGGFAADRGEVTFQDQVLGRQACVPAESLGDFPITQKSGEPSYQLAVVVDDGAMGITQVVRGDDLVASTFRQIELFQALQLGGAGVCPCAVGVRSRWTATGQTSW